MEITVHVSPQNYPCFTVDGRDYHITLPGGKHVTDEYADKRYYFDTEPAGDGTFEIRDIHHRKHNGKADGVFQFSQLPRNVQTFIRRYYREILAVKKERTFRL